MKDRQNFQIVEWTLVYESLVDYTEINQALAAYLHRGQFVAQIIFIWSGNEVPQVIDAETGADIFLLSFLR
jgi:hypothetical protein